MSSENKYLMEEEVKIEENLIEKDLVNNTNGGIFETFLVIVSTILSLILFPFTTYMIKEYERAVFFRNGRCRGSIGPGLVVILPFVDSIKKIDLRTLSLDVTKQEIITKDSVTVQVDAVVFYRVFDQLKSVINVGNYFYSTGLLAQSTLRAILGENTLDEILQQREKINEKLQKKIF